MRPYHLYPEGPWIDLDAIQEVIPPEFTDRNGFFIEMSIRFAFQDQLRVYRWRQEWTMPPLTEDTLDFEPSDHIDLDQGVPTQLVRVEMLVFRPLMRAWAGVKITGPVHARGWLAAVPPPF